MNVLHRTLRLLLDYRVFNTAMAFVNAGVIAYLILTAGADVRWLTALMGAVLCLGVYFSGYALGSRESTERWQSLFSEIRGFVVLVRGDSKIEATPEELGPIMMEAERIARERFKVDDNNGE